MGQPKKRVRVKMCYLETGSAIAVTAITLLSAGTVSSVVEPDSDEDYKKICLLMLHSEFLNYNVYLIFPSQSHGVDHNT